jgi:hypothetical protein
MKIELETEDYDGSCLICKQFVSDQYMVNKDVWSEAAFNKGFCHLKCLQQKLGRPLLIDDFTDAPVNDSIRFGYELGQTQIQDATKHVWVGNADIDISEIIKIIDSVDTTENQTATEFDEWI